LILEDADLILYLERSLSQTIDKKELDQAKETASSFHVPLPQVLLDKSLVSEKVLGELISKYLNVPYVTLKHKDIPNEVLNILSEDIAQHHQVLVFSREDQNISVAMSDPKNYETIDFIEKKTEMKVRPYFVFENDLHEAFGRYRINIKDEFKNIIAQNIQTANINDAPEQAAQELPVIKVLNTILEYAIAEKASDIHMEGIENNIVVRYRIDGILHDIISLPKKLQFALVARIKILSNLKIDEHRLPQDGRFNFDLSGSKIALRVSVIPTYFGENMVLRVLAESERANTLEELGFADNNLKIIESNMSKSHGMILITGPTGSGKTTTLYSLLNILNSPEVKVCTVEDPIEYGIRRISQIQVNTKTGLTFAEGLRSLLRHDPDILMVGEIRDQETATISIHSALTGHLVLSTLHTNDAASAIPRFLDLGIEGFLITSTVNVIIAQRLVRKLCPYCKIESPTNPELIAEVVKNSEISPESLHQFKFYISRGCHECNQSGYAGRIGIYEALELNDEIRELVLKREQINTIKKAAIKNGMTSMLVDGLRKAAGGITSLEEILRVTRE
jgi:type IV pilus assembly protein PilB